MPVYKDKARNSWFVRIYTTDTVTGNKREIKKRGFATKREASAWEIAQRHDKQNITSTSVTFQQLDEKYIDYKNPAKESTRIQERKRIEKYIPFKDMPVDQISKTVLLDWYVDLSKREDLSVSVKNYLIGVVRSVLRFGSDFYGTENHSSVLKKLRKRAENGSMDVWTPEELNRFLEEVSDPEYRAFFDFLYWTGCRRGEALALRIQDVDLQAHTVRIWHQIKYIEEGFIPLKTDSSERTLRIADPLWARLEPILETRDEERPFIFGGIKPLTITMLQRHLDWAVQKSGVKRIRLHDLRHSFASNAIASGANIVAVSKYLGHANITQTLQTYTHLLQKSDDELIRIVSSLDPVAD